MQTSSKVFVAGHRGLVGSALMRSLAAKGYTNVIGRTRAELDLTDTVATRNFFEEKKPEFVFLAAAKVGGILANNSWPADFIRENLAIQQNVIHEAWRSGVARLIFLGSSCIYPKFAPQPIKESCLLTGPLEATNRPYAIAKIAGIEMCWSYNRQHDTRYLAVMPTNLFGPGDNYDLQTSHVIPALLRKFDAAVKTGADEVEVWGTGTPRREFMYCEDMADACIHLMGLDDTHFLPLLGDRTNSSLDFQPPLINVGVGEDVTIAELAAIIGEVTGFKGKIRFDASKPDGTPRKLMDSTLLQSTGFSRKTELREGLIMTYLDFQKNANGRVR